jgi:ERCC4-type nuclease
MLITDTMDAVRSQLDGRLYDSKSALRKRYKQAGVVEVGNDSSITNPRPFKRPKVDRKAVNDSVDKAFARAGFGA